MFQFGVMIKLALPVQKLNITSQGGNLDCSNTHTHTHTHTHRVIVLIVVQKINLES